MADALPPFWFSWFSAFGPSWDSIYYWDQSDLTWDAGSGGNTQYLQLVTSEYNQQPDFMAMLDGVFAPLTETQATLAEMSADFDLDVAVGAQLDAVGLWVGISRFVTVPLTGVFFSWNTAGLGWGQGNWGPPGATQLVELNDADYLNLLLAKIAANQWDGTIPGAYAAWAPLFANTGNTILIQDYGDMSMTYALVGPTPSAVTLALYIGGYLNLQPAGVRIRAYLTPSVPSTPYFAWGLSNANMAGWGVGAWGVYNPGS